MRYDEVMWVSGQSTLVALGSVLPAAILAWQDWQCAEVSRQVNIAIPRTTPSLPHTTFLRILPSLRILIGIPLVAYVAAFYMLGFRIILSFFV